MFLQKLLLPSSGWKSSAEKGSWQTGMAVADVWKVSDMTRQQTNRALSNGEDLAIKNKVGVKEKVKEQGETRLCSNCICLHG
jgi:hypothetical protein